MRRIIVCLIGLAVAGCSTYLGTAEEVVPSALAREPGWIAVDGVPMILQKQKEDCGAAALAMALSYWGVPASLDRVVRDCPPEPGRGIKAGVLRDYARGQGLRAFLIRGDLDDLRKELSRGRPVVVGLVKPTTEGGLSHFEVVVGINAEAREVATLDPARGWTRNGYEGFLSEWESAGRLTLVLLPPGRVDGGD